MERLFNNPNLFPTPEGVIEQMFQYSSPAGKIILEPSAGTGNIVDFCKTAVAKEVIACEIQEDLRAILGRKCRLVGTDFLQLTSDKISHIDMIVMNPPFSADETHIMHAWNIAPSGCEILALCNYNTIDRPYTRNQKVFKETVQSYGSYKCFDRCFTEAERQTNVSIGFIRLLKPIDDSQDFDGYFDMGDDDSVDKSEEGITTYNYVQDIVSRYVDALKKFNHVYALEKEMNETISVFNAGIKFQPTSGKHEDRYTEINYEAFRKRLQASAWKLIFSKFNMEKFVTQGVRDDLNKFIETQQAVPFTVKNVYKMIQMVVGTRSDRMDKVLVEAFEKICSYSAENSTAGETWRTNSDYKINRKFILPYCTEQGWYGMNIRYGKSDEINDILKALCFLTGNNYDDQTPLKEFIEYPYHIRRISDGELLGGYDNRTGDYQKASERIKYLNACKNTDVEIVKIGDNTFGQWIDWGFFRVKGFKKGTMHFEFKDDNLLNEFNLRVAKIKGWRLPKNTKQGPRAKSKDVVLF